MQEIKSPSFSVIAKKSPAWQREEGKSDKGGLNEKGRKSYERENPGSDLKAPVTEDKPKGERKKRQDSYCARSKGQMDDHNINCSEEPDKPICKSRRRWNCSSKELSGLLRVMKSESYLKVAEDELADACWEGYEAVGTKMKDGKEVPNCVPKGKKKKKASFSVLPDIDRDRHPERAGLEGPFRQPSGHVLYYDPKEGKYYDASRDMYIEADEYEAMQRPRS
tara:strand:- start:48850 stop:49515 length:666 start_codon:yes stop_codon:yes gene_type:complete